MKTINKPKHYSSGIKHSQQAVVFTDSDRIKIFIALAVIVLITLISYLPVFHNALLQWDDRAYIENNPLVQSFNLKEIFSQNVMGNYHPLTVLMLAIEYHLFGMSPAGYHAVNLLLHLLNVLLVFYAVYRLSGKAVVALTASLLFGIHPMHVESVAWAAELKDLLYTLFFLTSYIYYLQYIKDGEKKNLRIALLLFLLSLLSKAMAASLPLVFILTDYFKGRKINRETLVEKVPFLALSVIFGIVAVVYQQSYGATDYDSLIKFPQRIIFASYGYITYLVKLVIPLKLSAYYPYPVNINGVYIPGYFHLYFIGLLALAGYFFYRLRRLPKEIVFGLGFFTITVLPVLQLLPVGRAIMADRYSYLPSIGIFYLAGAGVVYLLNRKMKWPVIVLAGAATLLFSVKTYARCGIWKSDMTLWNDIISQDKTVEEAYYKGYFFDKKGNNEADKTFNKPDEVKPVNAEELFKQGTVLAHQFKNDEAIKAFSHAIELNPGYAEAYNLRGIVYVKEKKSDEAVKDFTRAIELKPDNAEAYNNRGIAFLNEKKYEEALKDFDKATGLNPGYALAYNNKGNVLYEEKKYKEAIAAYTKAIELKPDYAEAFYKRGMAEHDSGKNAEACEDLKKAAMMGNLIAAGAYGKLCR